VCAGGREVVLKFNGRQVDLRIEICFEKCRSSVSEWIFADCVTRRCKLVIRGVDRMCSTIECELYGLGRGRRHRDMGMRNNESSHFVGVCFQTSVGEGVT
jgi:hypothetical protein